MSRRFELVSGPTQSWLIVTAPDLAKVRLNRCDFSNASLISQDGSIALEDTLDALVFLKSWHATVGSCTLVGAHHKAGDVATWAPFGTRGIDAPSYSEQGEFDQSLPPDTDPVTSVCANDPRSWINAIWHVLHMARENCISEDANGPNDQTWEEVCTAMAWVSEELELAQEPLAS